MPRLEEMFEHYRAKVNFLFVYILEAHAQNEWPICSSKWCPSGKPVRYDQTTTYEARRAAALDFIKEFDVKIPVVLDDMNNTFESIYAGWPLRIYVVDRSGVVTYKAQPEPDMLELKHLARTLENL